MEKDFPPAALLDKLDRSLDRDQDGALAAYIDRLFEVDSYAACG